jgi:hypothetical protein
MVRKVRRKQDGISWGGRGDERLGKEGVKRRANRR